MPGYLVPTNTVDQSTTVGGYNVFNAVNAGTVLQVVNFTTTAVANTNGSTSSIDSNVTLSITPSSNTSKILVLTSQPILVSNGGSSGFYENAGIVELYRDSTLISDHGVGNIWYEAGGKSSYSNSSFNYLDSPATTNSVIYKTKLRSVHASFFVYAQNNSNYSGTLTAPKGSITLMEIAG
jgi:hypothetical protein